MEVGICFFHGGMLIIEDGVIIYKGGILEYEMRFDEDQLSRLELLRAIWELGYEQCGGLYYKENEGQEKDGQFVELCNDVDVTNYTSSLTGDIAIVYVDSPYDDMSKWTRIEEDVRGVHISRATIEDISNMSIRRTPKVEVEAAASKKTQAIEIENTISREGSKSEESGESDSDSESENVDSNEEASDLEINDDEDSEAGLDDDLTKVAKEGKNKLRVERSNLQKKAHQQISIKLGPVGVDKGLESYIKYGKHYSGLLAGNEDYIGSSDVDSFASDEEYESEDENHETGRRKKTRVHYDPKCEEPLWELGMVFKSVFQFREAVVYYSIKKGVQTYYQQNEHHRVRVRCSYVDNEEKKCPWLLYASLDKKNGDFVVKNYQPEHVCVRQNKISFCDAKFIAKYYKDYLTENPTIKVWKLQEKLKKELQLYISKHICRKGRSIVLKAMVGDYKEEFRRLYDYRDCLLQTNPGSTCIVDVNIEEESGKHIFKGMYVCFSAMKEGFKNGCRPCIGFDGCFLKGVFKGQLLAAVAKNANHQIFPLAWAVVHNETAATWTWFCELLHNDLNLDAGNKLTVVTDMQKGLDKAITDVLPNAEHRECARHILANWAKKWRGVERRQCFWRCEKSSFESELKENLKEMAKLGDVSIIDDLQYYNLKRWCRVFFKFDSVCDTVDNNFCETFNSWILAPRHKSILSLFEEIRIMIMRRHTEMLQFPHTWITDISPMAFKMLQNNVDRAMRCCIIWNGDDGYEVQDGPFKHVVSLTNKSCSCRSWSLKGIPCPHAVTAMHSRGIDPLNHIHKWYHKDTFMKTYSFFIQPMPNMEMIPESSNPPVEPPPIRPLPGRPKRNRRQPRDELKKCGKASKSGVQMTCSYCKGKNHNKKGCAKRKFDSISQNTDQPVNAQPSAAKGPTTKVKQRLAQPSTKPKPTTKRNQSHNTAKSGYGVFISESTGWTCMQNGNPQHNKVISTGHISLKSSAVVTGDLGFKPKTQKWKDKAVSTREQQRMRAAANKARAESILAARNQGGSSSQPESRVTNISTNSASQPIPQRLWKL